MKMAFTDSNSIFQLSRGREEKVGPRMSEEHRRTEASGTIGQKDGLWKASRFLCYFFYVCFVIPPSQRWASTETERVFAVAWMGGE